MCQIEYCNIVPSIYRNFIPCTKTSKTTHLAKFVIRIAIHQGEAPAALLTRKEFLMNLVSIEPTPNRNNMKINFDESLDSGVKYTFTQKDKTGYPQQIQRILSVPGVVRIFQVNNFMSVQKQPGAGWEDILIAIREILEGEKPPGKQATDKRNNLDENFGEMQVYIQTFRRIPMLVKISNGKEEQRFAIDKRFQDAVFEGGKGVKNILAERKWIAKGNRYGTFDQVGNGVVDEINATYNDRRLQSLVEQAIHYDPSNKEKNILGDDELNEYIASENWRMRFAALSQIGADPSFIDLFVKMASDLQVSVRRLAIIYLGLVKNETYIPH